MTLAVPASALALGRATLPAAESGQPFDLEVATEPLGTVDTDETVSCETMGICQACEGDLLDRLDPAKCFYGTHANCPGRRSERVRYSGGGTGRFTARVLDHGAEIARLTALTHDGDLREVLSADACRGAPFPASLPE